LHDSPPQANVKRATGVAGGPEVMKAEYRNLLVVAAGTAAVVEEFVLSAAST
jgi:hypothetical protein